MKSSKTLTDRIRLLAVAVFTLVAVCGAYAQPQQKGKHQRRPDKTEWLRKMKEVKHDFLARELNLSAKQSDDFFRIYDNKEESRFQAERAVRKIEREIRAKGDEATEADYDKCIKAQYGLMSRLAEIEKKYESQLRSVLSKRQLAELPCAERKFQRQLMEQRHNCPPPPKP